MKYSLFLLEKKYHKGLRYVGEVGSVLTEDCCIHLGTFNTLEQAKAEQKERAERTIILPSY